MIKRRRVKQTDILEDRLSLEAIRLREEAKGMNPGPAREAILRKARQADRCPHERMAALARSAAAKVKPPQTAALEQQRS
jgi:hypothetical protein